MLMNEEVEAATSSTATVSSDQDGKQSPMDERPEHPPPQGIRTKVQEAGHQAYQKIVRDFILRRKPLPSSEDGRNIPLRPGRANDLIDERNGHPFVTNTIRTARYNVFDFFPRQLIFQFSRLGNFYFLCIGVPQAIPGLSTTGNYTTILPLLFFVLLTIFKEGYDDYKRHRLDNVENATLTHVLRKSTESPRQQPLGFARLRSQWLSPNVKPQTNKRRHTAHQQDSANGFSWIEMPWRDLQVGDVVRLNRDDDVPADLVLLGADGANGIAYIETMALDGETNLKNKQALPAFASCNSIEGILTCDAEFVLEDPHPDLYHFDGRAIIDGKIVPLGNNEIIYRGSTLRNTPHAVGIVVNTGEECKIRLNANQHPRAKRPALESVYNKIVLTLVVYVICLTTGCSIGYLLWQKRDEGNAWYLNGYQVPAQEIIIGYAIQYNNVIPLALYVSLEIIKIGQMLLLNQDIAMYHEASNTPARSNTNTILENLGQIGYVFSDKTGTLTENVMKFRKMTVAGTAWLHASDLSTTVPSLNTPMIHADDGDDYFSKTSNHNNNIPQVVIHRESDERPSPTPSTSPRPSSQWRSTARPDRAQPEMTTDDLVEFIRGRPNAIFAKKATQYILAMALCHTCLPEMKDDGTIDYQASSPDELALVEAARDLGYTVVQRTPDQITLQVVGFNGRTSLRKYDLLDVIEFSSKRKRMSIILRCPDGTLWMICKGADSMILPRLRMAQVAREKATEVRQSADLERAMLLRRSEAQDTRTSFGGRSSLNLRRSLAKPQAEFRLSSLRPTIGGRSKSFEVGSSRRSADVARESLAARGVSIDIPRTLAMPSPNLLSPNRDRLDRFSILDDPSLNDDATIFARSFKLMDDFATEGLRTLLFASKHLTEDEYSLWKKVHHDAETSLVDRQDRIEAAGELIEQNLELVGASAIEDKLQKGVPETIEKLRRANMKIWMLTGDKRETAINIAHSARICRPESEVYILDSTRGDLESYLLEITEEMRAPQNSALARHTVVVIDGHTLGVIEGSAASQSHSLFFNLIPKVDSVICCRASPAQKASLVRAIRKNNHISHTSSFGHYAPLTLAIGDGANDLAMLAEAHVGVGISGREGLQAARVADYAIAQFSYLQRLLLVHGRWNYSRTANFVLWTFWKEMFFYIPTEIFSRYTGYTGTSLYESWSLTVLNALFTSLAVILPGIYEQDLCAETLLAVPELYVYGQKGMALDVGRYFGWMLSAGVEGIVVFFFCFAGYVVFADEPKDDGLFAFGNLVFTVCIVWINVKLLIVETHTKTIVVLVGFLITVGGWWLWQAFLAGIYPTGVSPYAVHGSFFNTFGRDGYWWLTMLGILVFLLAMTVGFKLSTRMAAVLGSLRRERWMRSWFGWKSRRSSRRPLGRNHEKDWDLSLWQEMEKNPVVRARIRDILRGEDCGDDDGDRKGGEAIEGLGIEVPDRATSV